MPFARAGQPRHQPAQKGGVAGARTSPVKEPCTYCGTTVSPRTWRYVYALPAPPDAPPGTKFVTNAHTPICGDCDSQMLNDGMLGAEMLTCAR
jgi:hypothetical protein